MRHNAESIFVVEFNRISPRIRNYSIWKTVLAHESRDPGVQFNKKTEGRNILYDHWINFFWECPNKSIGLSKLTR
jgi:hypothetical protein